MKNNIMKLCALCALGISAIAGANLVAHANISSKNEASAASSIETYYKNVDTSDRSSLISSLRSIISSNYTSHNYDTLWTWYGTTDIRSDGCVQDYYSNISKFKLGTDQAGSYSGEGDVYNREHSIPKSWWGGSKSDQGCDVFIVVPTDGWVNSMRSNYPFGEVDTAKQYKQSSGGYSKLGTSVSKYSINTTVFECADEWKGDFARIYFYAVTRWNTTSWTSGDGSKVFATSVSSPNYGLTSYAKQLFLDWNELDPVDDWEKERNNNVQSVQGNRNPYIDHPEWIDYIWGGEELDNKVLTSISKSGTLVKTTYEAGQSFDPEGLTITAKYDDTSEENVTSSVTWSPDPLTQGTTSVTGTYTYKGVSKTVTVSGLTVTAPAPKTLDHISVSGQKTTYYVGDTFVKPTVTAYYTDSTSAVVTNSATFTGFDSSEVGSYTITVTYGGKQYTYQIVVKEKSSGTETYTLLQSTSNLTAGDNVVIACDSHEKTAGNISSSFMSPIDSAFDSEANAITSLGKETIEFTLESNSGKWALNSSNGYLNITNEKSVSWSSSPVYLNITISSGTATICDDSSSSHGTLQYNAGAPRFTTYKSSQKSIQLYAKSSGGSTEEPELDYIEVSSPKTSYTVGDTFVKPTVIAHYDDDSTQTVTTATFSGYNMSAVGNYTVTVSYGGKTTTYTITVIASTPTHGKSADDPLTTVEAIEKADDGEKYYIECIIISIKTAWSSQFKNISYWAYTGTSDEFQIFRLGDTADPNYEMGTTLILYSEITQYDGFFETTAAPELIKVITIEEKATAFAEEFNSANVCGTNNNTSAISSIWLEQSSAYSELDTYTRDYLKNATPNEENETIKECLTRYDRVIELHGSDNTHFPDFMNRGGSSSAKRTIEVDNEICLIVTLTTIVSGSFTLCYLLFKKRKISKK